MFYGIPLKLISSNHVVGFNERTIAARASEFVTSAVVVPRTIRSCGELLEELQVCKGGGINDCCFMSSV